MRKLLFYIGIFKLFTLSGQVASEGTYLESVKVELQKQWPKNRTVNIVFHGHSVPCGYSTGGVVDRCAAYPFLTLQYLDEKYPYAVINCITSSIGGEKAAQGNKRLKKDVLSLKPDVVFIDYALNDRAWPGESEEEAIEKAQKAWNAMIKKLLSANVLVILMTPTPDTAENILTENAPLSKHAEQIRRLAATHQIGLVDSYKAFQALTKQGIDLKAYMAQNNHPNEKGHQIVTKEITKWF